MSHPRRTVPRMEGPGPTPSQRGASSEAEVACALVRSGARVYLPAFGSHGRIDLVYERDCGVVRVQMKTASLIGDTLRFWTTSNTANSPVTYAGQIDEFGVYSPDTGLVYIVPADGLPSGGCFLRLGPTRNGQRSGIRWASEYVLSPDWQPGPVQSVGVGCQATLGTSL